MSYLFQEFEKEYQVTPLDPNNVQNRKINEVLSGLFFNEPTLKRIATQFETEMNLALNERWDEASLLMENTYIPELPDGTENGKFLALDLGGTNFRVILLELDSGKITNEVIKMYEIGDELRVGGEDVAIALFDHIGQCLCDFVEDNDLVSVPLPLGFTFSFPMKQHSLRSATLDAWAKSFNLPTVIKTDVVDRLRESLHKLGHNHIEVAAILNDTTSTLIQGVNLDKRTRIGIIFGTGSNAAYVEQADRVKHWEGKGKCGAKQVCIDIEWGAFGDKGSLDFIRTRFDDRLDETSLLPGSYTFEKYIGGKYLGELVRLVLEEFHQKKLAFQNTAASSFPGPWSFDTREISTIEEDNLNGTTNLTREVLAEAGFQNVTDHDVAVTQHVAAVISHRAALLVAVTTSVLLARLTCKDVTIAIDGSVYKNHPRMDAWLNRIINRLNSTKKIFRLMLAEDGSGKGAALTAAIALKLENQLIK